MLCQRCGKNEASVHVIDVEVFKAFMAPDNKVTETGLCEVCCQNHSIGADPSPAQANFWKLLQAHAGKIQAQVKLQGPACPECGMTLEEIRRKGRIGCANDYKVFAPYMKEMLERMHGASAHVGRLPGIPEADLVRAQRMNELKDELDMAIRKEDFERAADLRDQIADLESHADA